MEATFSKRKGNLFFCRRLWAGGICSLALVVTTLVPVQVAADQAEETDRPATLEEIIVTGQKREDPIQEVPFSIAVQTGENLIERGSFNIEEIARNIASFSIQNLGPGQSQVTMRGVSSGQIVRDQPGVKEQVGMYLDESVISLSLFTPDLELVDISRVEVLRGPQGTLFGSGSLSGTVRYITNQPALGLREAQIYAEGNVVDEDDFGGSLRGVLNAPIGDNAAFRIVPYYTRMGGFIDAIQPDGSIRDNVNSGERYGMRMAFRVEPSPALSITPRLVYQKTEIDGFNRQDAYNILANPFTTTRPPVNIGRRQQFTQFKEKYDDEFLLLDLAIDFEFDNGMTLTSISSFTDRDILQVRDATQLTGSITGGSIGLSEEVYTLDAPLADATEIEAFTQEIRLSGHPEDRLRWVVGAFYSDMDREYGQSLDVTGFEDLTGIPTAGPRAGKDILFFSDIPYNLEQFALFGEATWAATEQLDLTFGLRYFDFTEKRVLNFDGIFADTTIGEAGRTSSDGFSPRFMANYEVNENLRLNAQVAKGFRLGGINDPLNVPLCSPQDLITFGGRDSFDDEELWNYEVGAKTSFMDGRGIFNVAVFHMDIDGLQATTDAGTCSSRIIFNVPDSRVQGIDTELFLRPTRNWNFSLAASLLDAELRSTITSVDQDGVAQVVEGIEKGNRLPTTPKFEANASVGYTQPLANGREAFANFTFQHVGSRFTQIGDQAEGFGTVPLQALPFPIGDPDQEFFVFDPKLPSYNIGNFRAGVRTSQWEAAFFVNNIWDEHALLALDRERGRLARVGFLVNQPRTIGVTWRYFFL